MKKIKHIAWFLIKSPQRKFLGYGTLITDFKGWMSRQLRLAPNTGIVWVCVGNYNRSRALLKYLVSSMNAANNPEKLGLSLFDCGSTDVTNLEKELSALWKGPLIFSSENVKFTRSHSFNKAILQVPEGLILVSDADISLPKEIVELVYANVSDKTVWFPICQHQLNADSKEWKWQTGGTGMFAARKEQVEKAGYYDETYTSWGREDWQLFFDFYKVGLAPVRSRVEGMYHHWHQSLKPEDYKNWF